ncbi:uncharacterized protein LOC6536436 [Drosophila yakuba]|uniref:WAP domain-containing protein n=1 Tax=Drosophila yakuba TaxID=7245 RepID=B4PVF6_DROYA|nr:uncharacterized protein LOC6536436 [Drosophila yakuba]EDW96729.2 uncharacterized protein Dyak_GE25989 [Drosophila yakuba]
MRLIWLQLLAAGGALYLAIGCATAAKASTSRGVAQYKLPLPAPLPDHESVATNSGADPTRRQPQQGTSSQRRRTQVVRRRRPSSTTTSTTSSTSTTTTTTSTTTTTTTTTPRPSLANGFNFFNRNFWSFGQQSLVAVRPPTKQPHPPKKFSPKEEKSGQRKLTKTTRKPMDQRTTAASRGTTTTTQKPTTDGPFRIALPTLNFPHDNKDNSRDPQTDKEKGKRSAAELRLRFDCPRENEVRFQLFPKICKTDRDCAVWQRDELCCDIFGASSCVSGVPKPLEEAPHAPILGLIPRKCPSRPLAELWWDVQECSTDMDCWPRVCCPDGRRRYCRTSQPELETAPVPVKRSFDYLTEYLECTAPPPPIFDLHPKACTSTLDCFPNVCCQEAGLRHCRPPKKSVLTLMANFLNVDFVKRLAQNIVIK